MIEATLKEILRVRVISAKMPSFWYAHFIGRYLYAIEEKGILFHCTEYGLKLRSYFDPEDVKIDKIIKLEDKRVIKS